MPRTMTLLGARYVHHQSKAVKSQLFSLHFYAQVINKHIMEEKGWECAINAPTQVVTVQSQSSRIVAEVHPNSGDGWKLVVQGRKDVGSHQLVTLLVVTIFWCNYVLLLRS